MKQLSISLLILLTLQLTSTVSRALSISALRAKKYDTIQFTPPFADAFGEPETSGVWFVAGMSGSGKTTFMWQLARELSAIGRVAINSLEEGTSKTLQESLNNVPMTAAQQRRMIAISENRLDLSERLRKQKSPRVVIIDSIQYFDMNWRQYVEFKDEFAHNKLFIFTSHLEGRRPVGRTAFSVQHDASLKIHVEGFRAFSRGRTIGDVGHFDIYPKKARTIWGSSNSNQQP